jgi:signal transduction histidine kinase
MAQTSIQRRLIATVLISQALLASGVLLAGIYYTQRRLVATLDEAMQAHAMSVAALVRYEEDKSGHVYFDQSLLPPSIDPDHADLFAVWTENSGLLAHSPNWPPELEVPADGDNHWSFRLRHHHYRGLRVMRVPVLDREDGPSFQPQTLTIVYASPLHRVEEQVRNAGVFISAASLILLGLTGILSYWGIRRGLSPLQQLAGEAAKISSQNWHLNVAGDVEHIAELRPLAQSMTTMLARLENSFTQQREFLGSAAHELKTPVAILKSTLQSLLQVPRASEEYRLGVEQSLEDLERLEQLLHWMMRLARAEQWAHGALRRDLPVTDVKTSLQEAIERMRPLADARQTKIRLSAEADVRLRADPEDLHLVWANLLENAVQYSPERGVVEIVLQSANGQPARVVVSDQGTGIPQEDLPHIFERFYRGDPSRARATGGFGLGLAIVKALVEAYGGTIRADSQPGEGTRMTVELPASVGTEA